MLRNPLLLFVWLALVQGFTPVQMFQRHSKLRTRSIVAAKDLTPEEHNVAIEKATKAMTAFTNKYLENTKTKLCSDKSVSCVPGCLGV